MPDELVVGNSQPEPDYRWSGYTVEIPAKPKRTISLAQKRRLKYAPKRDFNVIYAACDTSFNACVSVLPAAITLLPKNTTAAMVLSQIAFLFKPPSKRNSYTFALPDPTRTCVRIDGEPWAIVDHQKLADRTGLPRRRVRRAIATLLEQGLLARLPAAQRTEVRDAKLAKLAGRAGNLTRDKHGIVVFAQVLHVCEGRVPAAIVLSYIMYFFGKGRDGRCRASLYDKETGQPWISKSLAKLANATGLTVEQARYAAGWLVGSGLLLRRPGARTAVVEHPADEYSFDYSHLLQRLTKAPLYLWSPESEIS